MTNVDTAVDSTASERLNRRSKPVLVADVQALGMIGVVRSLGRAGYPVHAASSDSGALGLQSRFATKAVVHPPYASPDFLPWLERHCEIEGIQAIIPSEGLLHALSPRFDHFRRWIPDATEPEIWQRCLSKVLTHEHLLGSPEAASKLPAAGIIRSAEEIPGKALLGRHPGPFYIKADAGSARQGQGGLVLRIMDSTKLPVEAERLLADYSALVWQAHAPGRKVGVSLWRHEGEFLAENMTLGLHQNPHTGGMMSLRRTWWHPRLLEDAKRKMAALGWQGVAMMEYKWDPETDDFWFIEINARYWGYLHLDLFAGKDFPKLQMDGFFGSTESDLGPAKRAVTCRHAIPGDWGHLVSRLRDPDVGSIAKMTTAAGFLAWFAHPTARADLLFPGDGRLYWRQWLDFLSGLGRG